MVIEARLANEADGWAGSGAHPWHLDNETDSILFLTDMGDKPVRIGFQVQANGVHYYLTNLKLDPDETRAIDLRKLRDAQKPDFRKHVIPANATDGSVSWIRIDNVPVMGRVVVIQRHKGIASNYDCGTCSCPITLKFISVDPASINLIPASTMDCTCKATYENCNGYPFVYDETTNSNTTWSTANTAIAYMDSSVKGRVHGVAGGATTVTASYTGVTLYTINKFGQCVAQNGTKNGSSACDVASLSCGSATRGSSLTCTINNLPGGAGVSNWKFTEGTNTVTTSSTSSTWSGTAVRSGTVSVTVSSGGVSPSLSAGWTVNARTGWAFTTASPLKVANGSGTGGCAGQLPVLSTPTSNSSDFGVSCLHQPWSFSFVQVGAGPNTWYFYVSSASNANGSDATIYQWERVPDLDNTSSTFYVKQTGTYNASTDPTGCISGANLAAQTQRHENGSVQGHWGFYNNAQNSSSNNLGDVAEPQVGPPSWTSSQFQNTVNSALSSAKDSIQNATFGVEPYPVNDDQNGTFLGYINFPASYTSCK